MHFIDKLESAIRLNSSLLIVGLDPNPELLSPFDGDRYALSPENSSSRDALIQQLSDWLQWVIAQTADLVCAYKPTLGFYEALGSAGLDLLQSVLKAIPAHIPVILDAKHSA
jgi:uridine monophosphate synthetase